MGTNQVQPIALSRHPGARTDSQYSGGENPEQGKEGKIGVQDTIKKIPRSFAMQVIEHVNERNDPYGGKQSEQGNGFVYS